MVSKLFVTDNLFCCWSNWHWARIIFLRSALPLIWGDLHAGLLVSHVRWLWIQFWLLLCYVCITTIHGVLYQSYAVLCDGFWWRRILYSFEASQCYAPNCHAMHTKVFLYKNRHMFEKNLCTVDSCGRLWLAWPVINTLKKNSTLVSLVTCATWSIDYCSIHSSCWYH